MRKAPGEPLTADEIRGLPAAGWAISGILLQSQPGYFLGKMGDIEEKEAAALRETLAERVADGSIRVTFMEEWGNGKSFRVHHVSGETMKGSFDIEGF